MRAWSRKIRKRAVAALRRVILALTARMWTEGLEELLDRIIRQRAATLPTAESLGFLFRMEDKVDSALDLKALVYGGGVHPKHRLTGYHDFFVDRISSGERVLDVGCGNGTVTCDIAERCGADVVGIDLSDATIGAAWRRHAHPRVRYVVGDALKDIPAGPFDVVVLSNVLEHLPSRVKFLGRLRAATGAKRFLVRVPVRERDWRVPLRRELGLEWRSDLTHKTEYTLESFVAEMHAAGLIVRDQENRWGEIWAEAVPLALRRPAATVADGPRVCYAHPGFPGPVAGCHVRSSGGAVKYQYLDGAFPHRVPECDILYAVSSANGATQDVVRAARGAGVRLVWNQNGTYVPWAYDPETMAAGNRHMAAFCHVADYVLYQSDYCRRTAEQYLGKRQGPGEVLYNAVDSVHFSPAPTAPDGLTLLACGSHEDPGRLPIAIQTLAAVKRSRRNARLIIAGRILHPRQVKEQIEASGVADWVDVVGPYTQETAPQVFRRAHILLQTNFNDACPTVVLEAMACGLPVVYSASGGVPELVGPEAGFGVAAPAVWEDVQPPDPEEMANGVLALAERWAECREAARQRAVDRFGLRAWIRRHAEVFQMLLEHS